MTTAHSCAASRPSRVALTHAMRVCLLLTLVPPASARGRRAAADDVPLDDFPSRAPTKKEAADSGATLEQARSMPWRPVHNVTCGGGALCRPGEGNLKGYKMWGQPYLHREPYVQSKSRRPPHEPEPATYAEVVQVARAVQQRNVVLFCAGDLDFREVVLNWYLHATQLGYRNAFVLSMDNELHGLLQRRRIPSANNAANVDEWNATCLQRHIQRVRTERQLAIVALVSAGLDVLHTDASVVFVRDVLAFLASPPLAEIDLLVQREGGPAGAVKRMGTAVNAGFTFVRARRPDAVRRFFHDVVRRGLVEFYNRWNNVIDQMGWSMIVADTSDLAPPTSQLANESTVTRLERYGLQLAFLPYDRFPRVGSWSRLRDTAMIHHLVEDGSLGPQFAHPDGVVPFRGHRQRLDRYDEEDFARHQEVMKSIGLWLVPPHERWGRIPSG